MGSTPTLVTANVELGSGNAERDELVFIPSSALAVPRSKWVRRPTGGHSPRMREIRVQLPAVPLTGRVVEVVSASVLQTEDPGSTPGRSTRGLVVQREDTAMALR